MPASTLQMIQKILMSSRLQAAGCQLIDKAPRGGAEGLRIGFLHPKSTFRVLTELCGTK